MVCAVRSTRRVINIRANERSVLFFGSFGPDFVRAYGRGLIGRSVLRVYGRDYEIFGRHGIAMEAAEHRQLPGVGHRVCERTLQKPFFGHPLHWNFRFEKAAKIGKHFVKPLDVGSKIVRLWAVIDAADEKRSGVPEHAPYMADQFVRSADLIAGLEFGKSAWRIAQSFLGSVGKRRQKMAQHFTFFGHIDRRGRNLNVPKLRDSPLRNKAVRTNQFFPFSSQTEPESAPSSLVKKCRQKYFS
jgi:hypothetical protein